MKTILSDREGFTLIEIMLALVVFSIGILAVAAMQVQSIRANSTGYARDEANSVALSFMEVFVQLPYDNGVLADGDGTTDGEGGLDDGPGSADYGVVAADFASGGVFENLGQLYTLATPNTLVTNTGREFQVYWNVAERTNNLGSNGAVKVIRLHIHWTAAMGDNSAVMTLTKYKNIAL